MKRVFIEIGSLLSMKIIISFHSRDATIPTNPDVATFGLGHRPALDVWYRRRLWFSPAFLQFITNFFIQPTPTPAIYPILLPQSGVLPTPTLTPPLNQQKRITPTPTALPQLPYQPQQYTTILLTATPIPTVFIKPTATPTPKISATKPSPTPAKNIKGVSTENRPTLSSISQLIRGLWESVFTILGFSR